MWALTNEKMRIKIKELGAELSSIYSMELDKEILWQGDSKYWTGQAPILFPIVGSLKDGFYLYEGEKYELPRHGFARRKVFEPVEVQEKKITLSLKSDKETLEVYPFDFQLLVTYELSNNKVKVGYEVINKNNGCMYFSIGAHPAFNADIERGGVRLSLDSPMTKPSYKMDTERGLLMREYFPVYENSQRISINYEWFQNDTLVFDSLGIQSMQMEEQSTRGVVRVEFEKFPYLGVWTPNAPFLCIEPWHGVTDFIDGNHNLAEKTGIIKIDEGKTFACSYTIRILS